ncbi:unnamed protein product [Linum trigynum]|uniref:Uncharacterized protein n=1 Tax=Linum trigynum TaxID=586398 RepID=A0AAV2D4Y0_9ROSI
MVTFAVYQLGKDIGAGEYKLGRPGKLVDMITCFYISYVAMINVEVDFGEMGFATLSTIGFITQFHCFIKLRWRLLDYNLADLVIDSMVNACICGLQVIGGTVKIVGTAIFCAFCFWYKYSTYLRFVETYEERDFVLRHYSSG